MFLNESMDYSLSLIQENTVIMTEGGGGGLHWRLESYASNFFRGYPESSEKLGVFLYLWGFFSLTSRGGGVHYPLEVDELLV